MENNILISIIIPVYNRPKLIAECLDSVLSQTNPNWECIVVDDGSTDDTWKVLEDYAAKDERIRIFKRHREPKGAPTCRNIGADNATGDYLIFFDSDDLFLPWFIDVICEELLKNQDVEMLAYQQMCKDANSDRAWMRCVESNPEGYIYRYITFKKALSTSSIVWKKSSFFKTSTWDESLLSWQDPPLILNAFFLNFTFKWLNNTPLALIRIGNDETRITNAAKVSDFIKCFDIIYNNLSIKNRLVFKKSIHKLIWNQIMYISKYRELHSVVSYLSDKQLMSKWDNQFILLYYKLYKLTKKIIVLRYLVYKFQFIFYKKLSHVECVYIDHIKLITENERFSSLPLIEQNKTLRLLKI
ncbi:MAG TPA: glycosyltransferase family 2 protein [Bacteroidales bacterium]|nr:glycosyltransferase family 2 protein [Bacteroidales bacterium]